MFGAQRFLQPCSLAGRFALNAAQEQLGLRRDPAETQTLSQVRFYESKASVTDCARGCQKPPHIQGVPPTAG